MKKPTKAALLSAFIFPGVGQVYLKKYTTGILLAGTSFAAMYYLIAKTIESALEISEKIQRGDLQLDIQAITALMSQQPSSTDTQALNFATAVLFICWLIGIVDAYRAGRAREKNQAALNDKQT